MHKNSDTESAGLQTHLVSWSALYAGCGDFSLAVIYLITWIDPLFLIQIWPKFPGPEFVGILVFGILFEFFIIMLYPIVGGLAYARIPWKMKCFLFVLPVGVVVFPLLTMLCQSFGGIAPAVVVFSLAINKWLAGRNDTDFRAATYFTSRFFVMAFFYCICLPLAMMSDLPDLGVEPWMARMADIDVSGPVSREPQKPLAAGAAYFFLLGLFEVFFHERLWRKQKEEAL